MPPTLGEWVITIAPFVSIIGTLTWHFRVGRHLPQHNSQDDI